MPALLALVLIRIRRLLPSPMSVVVVLLILAATAVVVLHAITAWITGHPLAVSALVAAAAAAAVASSTRRRVRRGSR